MDKLSSEPHTNTHYFGGPKACLHCFTRGVPTITYCIMIFF